MRFRFMAVVSWALLGGWSPPRRTRPRPPQRDGAGCRPGAGRGEGRGRGWGGGMMGRGVAGTVSEVAADHYTIKTLTGETYTIHYSANTRVVNAAGAALRRSHAGSSAGDQASRHTGGRRDHGEWRSRRYREIRRRHGGGEDRSRARPGNAGDAGQLRQDMAGGARDRGERHQGHAA